jgi:hypothetical protein
VQESPGLGDGPDVPSEASGFAIFGDHLSSTSPGRFLLKLQVFVSLWFVWLVQTGNESTVLQFRFGLFGPIVNIGRA